VDNQLIEQIEAARARTGDDARPGVVEKIHASDRLTARERITLLFDKSSFIEYGALAGATTRPNDEHYADGLVAGVGLIAGQSVVAASYDSSVLAGTQSDRNHRKIAKLLYLAVEHRWPFVCFVEGAGARPDDPLPAPPIAVSPRGRFELYDGLAELNGWAPTVAVVTGGEAYTAVKMQDITVTAGIVSGDFGLTGDLTFNSIDYNGAADSFERLDWTTLNLDPGADLPTPQDLTIDFTDDFVTIVHDERIPLVDLFNFVSDGFEFVSFIIFLATSISAVLQTISSLFISLLPLI